MRTLSEEEGVTWREGSCPNQPFTLQIHLCRRMEKKPHHCLKKRKEVGENHWLEDQPGSGSSWVLAQCSRALRVGHEPWRGLLPSLKLPGPHFACPPPPLISLSLPPPTLTFLLQLQCLALLFPLAFELCMASPPRGQSPLYPTLLTDHVGSIGEGCDTGIPLCPFKASLRPRPPACVRALEAYQAVRRKKMSRG